MVFSSLTFLQCFLPLCLLAYFLVPQKWRNGTLFLFSLLFYAWGEPVYVVLMLFSTTLDYTCGQMVERHRGQRGAKIALLVSLCVNLGLLGVFKYSDFLIGTVNSLFGTELPQPNLPLPIGISFYTFQTMSYTIDVYRGEAKAQKNIINFGAYVTLFPQLIAGPIVRYQTVADELEHRECTADLFADGVKRFACGVGKKVLLANNIGLLWEAASAQAAPTVLTAWLGVIAYSLQLYFDFSGYSLMAIGMGKMLGFDFPQNFNFPYISRSITEFWRRWHMTLSGWFREYVYIPLGGSKKGEGRTYLNLLVVWLFTGLWHGSTLNFLLWGLFLFALISLERLGWSKVLRRSQVISRLYMLLVIPLSWMLFAIPSLKDIGSYIGRLFAFSGGTAVHARDFLVYGRQYAVVLVIGLLVSTPLPEKLWRRIRTSPLGTVLLLVLFWVCVYCMAVATNDPFMYFSF